jgi:isopentenyl-diphosphate delta-isomerase
MDDDCERVVLVDVNDSRVGVAPKLEAHRRGLLHRAVSVFLRDPAGRILLQKRARSKYHSPGLWSNACCTHPRDDEAPAAAAARRLEEELGVRAELIPFAWLHYTAPVSHGLIENEFVHMFLGTCEDRPAVNPDEVEECRAFRPEEVASLMAERPHLVSPWFRIYADRLPELLQP